MRRLLIMRHGKSDWSAGTDDHSRPLNRRGVRSAQAMGRVLAEAGEQPGMIITSSAERARQTAELTKDAAGWDTPILETDDLYLTSIDGVLDVLAREGAHDSMMLVGHEPTSGNLVEFLTGGRVAVKTATVIALDTHSTWSTLGERSCSLGFILHPRMFTR